ncbi:hypothetical protein [Vitiosangium sp. GDMCC 1.1324]|uniref:hypothetical protein n=1 Tax=Vitiosangium sp. (strain GDMCC 1.1324) TaxID=2138576 RepID=UPI000D344A22|nr:hypothetical protein [Vitiosangium sp. GDMCC 1.1324]PTL81970.1 hypothetical protein DAT35_19330 [Vitiosangium sp. GDMCC 1.1324]
MNPELTADALVQLVHRYYPAGLLVDEPQYKNSEEAQRLRALHLANATGSPTWKEFIQRLREEFPGCSLWDMTVPFLDPCYICRVSLPGRVKGAPIYDSVVCLLSQLAPVYALYASHVHRTNPPERKSWLCFPPFPPDFHAHEARLAGLIESIFGFTRLSNDVLFTPVPDLVPQTANLGLGEAKLIDCLFTDHRW